MLGTSWPVFIKGRWWFWKPLPGLDPGLGESICWLAATKWAQCRSIGKPEAIAHQEAEQLAFETMYGLTYANNTRLFRKHHNR